MPINQPITATFVIPKERGIVILPAGIQVDDDNKSGILSHVSRAFSELVGSPGIDLKDYGFVATARVGASSKLFEMKDGVDLKPLGGTRSVVLAVYHPVHTTSGEKALLKDKTPAELGLFGTAVTITVTKQEPVAFITGADAGFRKARTDTSEAGRAACARADIELSKLSGMIAAAMKKSDQAAAASAAPSKQRAGRQPVPRLLWVVCVVAHVDKDSPDDWFVVVGVRPRCSPRSSCDPRTCVHFHPF